MSSLIFLTAKKQNKKPNAKALSSFFQFKHMQPLIFTYVWRFWDKKHVSVLFQQIVSLSVKPCLILNRPVSITLTYRHRSGTKCMSWAGTGELAMC